MSDNKTVNKSAEEYTEYWISKGALEARDSEEFQRLSKEKEEKFNMIVELTVPWQRNLVSELIDDIKSIENARSSIEMDKTVKLIYADNQKN